VPPLLPPKINILPNLQGGSGPAAALAAASGLEGPLNSETGQHWGCASCGEQDAGGSGGATSTTPTASSTTAAAAAGGQEGGATQKTQSEQQQQQVQQARR
jgi:hypothetical protein